MINSYIENQVRNADPLELVLMLYNKAISCLKISKKTIEEGLTEPEQVKKKAENLSRATEILAYLQGSLNFEKGQEIAKNLNEIYETLINELVKANMENDTEIIAKSIEILEDLKKAWEDVRCKIVNSKKS
ncbi:MAG: flagellar export chaperone FliS [Thermodesulfobacteria bacterium]|nr:flagellar export chaperone FliS [Thermodesulfobacteriota bacterium]